MQQSGILSAMALGYDWDAALKRVNAACAECRGDDDNALPADINGTTVAIQTIPGLDGLTPNMLMATASQECVDSVERDLASDTPELSVAELFERFGREASW